MQRKQPQSYEEWLSEIKFSNSLEDILTAAAQASRLNPDKKAARHDVALVLADKYRGEMQRAVGKPIAIRVIDEKFDKIAGMIFKSKFLSVYNYVVENEPSFDPKATDLANGGAVLGYIKPQPRLNDKGIAEPGLGFLDDDSVGGSSLGFL